MSTEKLIENAPASAMSSMHSLRCYAEPATIFEELPKATIIAVSRADASDISPLLLSYTIEVQYKQFKWRLVKKASQVIYLHFALRKRAIIEELHEKQEQVSSLFAFTNMRRFCAFFISSFYEYNNANCLRVLLLKSFVKRLKNGFTTLV